MKCRSSHPHAGTCGWRARPFRTASFVPAVALVLLTSPALASGGAEHAEGGLLPTWGWELFNFILLVAVLVYFARKPVQEFFQARRSTIASDIDEASRLLAEAERRNTEWQRRLTDLDRELDEIRATARRRAEEERERILAEAQDAAERIRRDAVAAVDQELRRAKDALRREAAELATDLAAGILEQQVGDSDRERLMDEFISHVESGSATSGGA